MPINEKNILSILAIFSISITVLAGCTKKISSEEAVSISIKAYIYNKETDMLQKAFSENETNLAQKDRDNFSTSLKEQFKLSTAYDKKIDELYKIYQINLKRYTKFSTEVLYEKQNKASVKVTVTGLKELDLDNLEAEIPKKLEANPDLIKADISEEETQQTINQLAFEIFPEKIKANTETKNAVTISIYLKEHPDDKNAWVIQDENNIFKKLSYAFGV